MVIWGWVGDPDPNSLLQILTTEAISDASDSQWSNARYDELYKLQNEASSADQRKTYMTEMQQLFYDQAPYQVLYYDDELHVYRSNKFGNWKNQPVDGGTPFFVNGSINYTTLALASAATAAPSASAAPSAGSSSGASAAPSSAVVVPSPSASGSGNGSAASDNTPLILGVVAVVALVAIGLVLARRRRDTVEEE
jgi:peptide/nickel transport system substrate-binding protein